MSLDKYIPKEIPPEKTVLCPVCKSEQVVCYRKWRMKGRKQKKDAERGITVPSNLRHLHEWFECAKCGKKFRKITTTRKRET